MEDKTRILLIEDDDFDAQKIRRDFADVPESNVEVEWRTSLETGVEEARRGHYDVMILDLGLPDRSGKETLVYARVATPQLPIIVLTGSNDHELALWSVKHGAQEYLVKGETSGPALLRALRYAIERHRMLARIEEYAREARETQTRIQRGLLEIRERLQTIDLQDADVGENLEEIRELVDALCAPIDVLFPT